MGWTIYYTIKDQEATILRCFGSEPSLSLPHEIDGFPVTVLGSACFAEASVSDATDPSLRLICGIPPTPAVSGNQALQHLTLPAHLRQIEARGLAGCAALARLELPSQVETLGTRVFDHCRSLRRVHLSEWITTLPDYAFADCRSLETLMIPASVTAIGSQCFYNCTHLQEMAFPRTLRTTGSGIFMNCSQLKKLTFPAGIHASVLLADLYQRLEVTVQQEASTIRLLFPEYAYEFEDIVMPRQFRTITYGSGGRYRECITGAHIDLEQYDALFRVAKLEEAPETVAMLALFRLMTPAQLRPEMRTQYLNYLREQIAPLGQEILSNGMEPELEFLLTRCALESQHLDTLMECARRHNRPRFVSRILNAKGMAPASANKSFDL